MQRGAIFKEISKNVPLGAAEFLVRRNDQKVYVRLTFALAALLFGTLAVVLSGFESLLLLGVRITGFVYVGPMGNPGGNDVRAAGPTRTVRDLRAVRRG